MVEVFPQSFGGDRQKRTVCIKAAPGIATVAFPLYSLVTAVTSQTRFKSGGGGEIKNSAF